MNFLSGDQPCVIPYRVARRDDSVEASFVLWPANWRVERSAYKVKLLLQSTQLLTWDSRADSSSPLWTVLRVL